MDLIRDLCYQIMTPPYGRYIHRCRYRTVQPTAQANRSHGLEGESHLARRIRRRLQRLRRVLAGHLEAPISKPREGSA